MAARCYFCALPLSAPSPEKPNPDIVADPLKERHRIGECHIWVQHEDEQPRLKNVIGHLGCEIAAMIRGEGGQNGRR